eukprot:415509_1
MIDTNGNNMLENDKQDQKQFGIYNLDGIKNQAMIVPDLPTIDGKYIINVTKYSLQKSNRKAMTRRGRKKKKQQQATISQQQIDQMKATKLVRYLEMCRNSNQTNNI